MLCVRVPPSLRRRVRLAAVANALTMQQLAVEALEDVCPATRRVSMHASLKASLALDTVLATRLALLQ
jgi:hypothetical protein